VIPSLTKRVISNLNFKISGGSLNDIVLASSIVSIWMDGHVNWNLNGTNLQYIDAFFDIGVTRDPYKQWGKLVQIKIIN